MFCYLLIWKALWIANVYELSCINELSLPYLNLQANQVTFWCVHSPQLPARQRSRGLNRRGGAPASVNGPPAQPRPPREPPAAEAGPAHLCRPQPHWTPPLTSLSPAWPGQATQPVPPPPLLHSPSSSTGNYPISNNSIITLHFFFSFFTIAKKANHFVSVTILY